MILKLINKDTLILGEFKFKCSIGRGGAKINKFEGDGSTPKGIYKLGKLYWRKDRLKKPQTKLICKSINKKMIWCNNSKSIHYNKETEISKYCKSEKMYRMDYKYNYLINILYNSNKIKKGRGSAIFLHLTKNYNKTSGCIAVKMNDFLVIAKLLNRKSKILIS